MLLLLICVRSTLSAQTNRYCTNNKRFTQDVVYTQAQLRADTGVIYGQDTTWKGDLITLKMDIYQPKPLLDTNSKHPFIIMMHGGAFSIGTRQITDTICKEFARRGFVAASIDYRLGWKCTTADTLSYVKAAYRAMQDLHAAMRFITANAALYRIDTAWMFAGGQSAGSATVLGLVYTSQAEINAAYPQIPVQLGNLNHADNTLTNTFTLKGIFNNWGSLEKPFYDNADALPMVSFHGDADSTVNIDSAKELNCVTQHTQQLPWALGSRALHNRLAAIGVCSDLTVLIGGGHGVFAGDSTDISFRAGRAACFFKMLFCNSCITAYREVTQRDPEDTNCPQTGSKSSVSNIAEQEHNWFIYPNPATNTVTVSGIDPSIDFVLSIQDAAGRKVLESHSSTTLDVAQLARGIYILKAAQNGHTVIYKLVKE
jgi:acetyl esterase/lipase